MPFLSQPATLLWLDWAVEVKCLTQEHINSERPLESNRRPSDTQTNRSNHCTTASSKWSVHDQLWLCFTVDSLKIHVLVIVCCLCCSVCEIKRQKKIKYCKDTSSPLKQPSTDDISRTFVYDEKLLSDWELTNMSFYKDNT